MSDYDIDQIFNHIRALRRKTELMFGWGHKQDLYRIKELVDDALQNTPTFPDEKEWLANREKQRIIKILQSK